MTACSTATWHSRARLSRLLPNEVNWRYDETHSAVAIRGVQSDDRFMAALTGIFAECARVLKPQTGRMALTFHHWEATAWAELTLALKRAGFRLLESYVVFSEHLISVHINNLNAIKHDCILILARDGSQPTPRWSPVDRIDASDSETFRRQCGATLGWLLESEASEDDIRAAWSALIQRKR
jgi:hypothetical protein